MNQTDVYPPQKWKIVVLHPEYKSAAPIRVNPTEFPDNSRLQFLTLAICNLPLSLCRQKVKSRDFKVLYFYEIIPRERRKAKACCPLF